MSYMIVGGREVVIVLHDNCDFFGVPIFTTRMEKLKINSVATRGQL